MNFYFLPNYSFDFRSANLCFKNNITKSGPIKHKDVSKLVKSIFSSNSNENILVCFNSLKKAFKQVLKASHIYVNAKALSKLDRCEDIPAFAQGLHALAINWESAINEMAQLPSLDRLDAAQDLIRALQKGIKGLTDNGCSNDATLLLAPLERIVELIQKEIPFLSREIEDQGNLFAARILLNLAREMRCLAISGSMQKWGGLQEDLNRAIPKAILQLAQTLVAYSAAQKAIAFRAGIDQIVSNFKSPDTLSKEKFGCNEVYIGNHAVFKRSKNRLAAEEEMVADGLGQLFDPALYVPQMIFSSMHLDGLEIYVTDPIQEQRAFSLFTFLTSTHTEAQDFVTHLVKALDCTLTVTMDRRVALNDITRWREYRAASEMLPKLRSQVFVGYQNQLIDFNTWVSQIQNGLISSQVTLCSDSSRNLHKFNRMLALAIQIVAGEEEPVLGHFYPNLVTGKGERQARELETAYERLERELWTIHIGNLQIHPVSVLAALMAVSKGYWVSTGGRPCNTQQQEDFACLSRTPSIIRYLPAALMWNRPGGLGHVTSSKPKINNLLLLRTAYNHEIEDILTNRLISPASELKAIRALYVQPLDLHNRNIGLSPVIPPEYARYENALFNNEINGEQSLSEVMRDYMSNRIEDETVMEILFADGECKLAKITDHPGLIETLNSPWKLEFFDTDHSLYETNGLVWSDRGSICPVQMTLVQSDFATRPLDRAAIAELTSDGNKIGQALRYLKKDYHPLLLRMDSVNRSNVRKLLDEYLTNYGLGCRNRKPEVNLAPLRILFATDLANNPFHPIWQSLEPVFAAAHVGTTSLLSPEMYEKRLEITSQLFPRATIAQQTAFQERLERQSIYLKQFQELQDLDPNLPFWQRMQICHSAFMSPIMPLNYSEQMLAKADLEAISNMPYLAGQEARLSVFLENFMSLIAPTLRNLVMVQYPITKEIFYLSHLVNEQYVLCDRQYPLEELLADARNKDYTEENCPSVAILLDKVRDLGEKRTKGAS